MKEDVKERKITYSDVFWLFMLGSILGFVLEGFFSIFNTGLWENHSATVWGPFCIVYGLGAVVLYALSLFIYRKNIFIKFFVCGICGSLIEYFAGWFQETVFGSYSWDYSDHFLNINGRISLRMTLIWGVFGTAFVILLFPLLKKLLLAFRCGWAKIPCVLASIFMCVNLLVSCMAILRWSERLQDIPPDNRIEEWIDNVWDNEKMSEIYSEMIFFDVKDAREQQNLLKPNAKTGGAVF